MTAFLPQEIIRKKRDGHELNRAEIGAFVEGITHETVTEGQAAAFAMAVFLRGMGMAERVALTQAMTRSGRVLDWSPERLGGPVLDKHSTGGVGDKTSLILGPVVAACGGFVPMISGRGLGHTGGTLDKLDSIPGYASQPSVELLRSTVETVGCAIVGATADIAPADRRLYAIRDVTGTVESIDLITASILSKKLAAGLQGLVLDVKFGSGALKTRLDEASELASSIVQVATGAGLPTTALLTDMNEVLGSAAGNAVEVAECLDVLTGKPADPRLLEVTVALSAELLAIGGLVADASEGRRKVAQALVSGEAAERFGRMVSALGGASDFLETYRDRLPRAPLMLPVEAERKGFVNQIDVRALGIAVVSLGGGRTRPQDPVDHAVGLTEVAGIGDEVGPGGRPLAIVHARNEAAGRAAVHTVRGAFRVLGQAPGPSPLIAGRIAAS